MQKQIPIKSTVKLFDGKYKFKIILLSVLSHWFRGDNFEKITEKFADPDCIKNLPPTITRQIQGDDGLDFVKKIYNVLKSMSDYRIRVERPYISIYTDDYNDIEKLAQISQLQVKAIFKPDNEDILIAGTIVSKRLDYAYKLTIGQTKQTYDSFVKWCENNKKIRISNATLLKLSNPRGYYQPGFLYIKDEKTLTMVKMFLGGCIQKIEKVVKV